MKFDMARHCMGAWRMEREERGGEWGVALVNKWGLSIDSQMTPVKLSRGAWSRVELS